MYVFGLLPLAERLIVAEEKLPKHRSLFGVGFYRGRVNRLPYPA